MCYVALMKPHVLVFQFRENDQARAQERTCIARELGDGVETTFLNVASDADAADIPAAVSHYDGFVLGGSGDFDFDGNRSLTDPYRQMSQQLLARMRPAFDYIFRYDLPTLGICYGHQLIGAYTGTAVVYSADQKKSKTHPVVMNIHPDDDPLLAGLPHQFVAHYGHKDVLAAVPETATLLMHSGDHTCRVSALRYQRHIYTTQFHPELRFADMVARIEQSPGYLPEGVSIEEVFQEDDTSNRILHNFASLLTDKRSRAA